MKALHYLIIFSIFALVLVIYELIKAPLIDDSFEQKQIKKKEMYCQEIIKELNIPYCHKGLAYELIEKCYRRKSYNVENAARIIERYISRFGENPVEVN